MLNRSERPFCSISGAKGIKQTFKIFIFFFIYKPAFQFELIIILTLSMGNSISHNTSNDTVRLQEIMELIQVDFQAPSRLSFDPFCLTHHDSFLGVEPQHHHLQDLRISLQLPEEEENPQRAQEIQLPQVFEPNTESINNQGDQQKNQASQKKYRKKKTIKKEKSQPKTNKTPKQTKETLQLHSDEEDSYMEDVAQISTSANDQIRGQNNCKTYHRLPKKYLQKKNLGSEIMKYEDLFATRYYFIIALILIKYHLNEDFTQTYIQLVNEELKAQQKKIENKVKQIRMIQKKLNKGNCVGEQAGELIEKKERLQKQIRHIQVVKQEMKSFSVKSCATFFQGDTEESLRILYLKNSNVIKKIKCFQAALRQVNTIQTQVRFSRQG